MSSESPGSWPRRCPPSLTSRARSRRDGSICVKLSPPRKTLAGKSYNDDFTSQPPCSTPARWPHCSCRGSNIESTLLRKHLKKHVIPCRSRHKKLMRIYKQIHFSRRKYCCSRLRGGKQLPTVTKKYQRKVLRPHLEYGIKHLQLGS